MFLILPSRSKLIILEQEMKSAKQEIESFLPTSSPVLKTFFFLQNIFIFTITIKHPISQETFRLLETLMKISGKLQEY